jgi:hypothetical protein
VNRLERFIDEHPGYVRLYVPAVATLTFLAVILDLRLR